MASLTQLLNTARDALGAQSYGLGVTGQNIANVNTPGYVRREAQLETRALGSQTTGTVVATGLRRVTDAFIERRQYESQGLTSAASEHDQRLESIEALFNDVSGSGFASSLSAMFGSFSALAANPADPTVRQNVLSSVDAFATRVRDTADSLAQSRTDLLTAAQATVTQVNDTSRAIAKLNGEISSAEAQGNDAADLKDQRGNLLMQMAELVDVRSIDSSGSIAVQTAGTMLVEGTHVRELSIDLDSNGALRVLAARTGGPASDITRSLTGGKLAGIRETRDVDLVEVGQNLDEFAFDIATRVNQQHAAGFGLDGVTGRDLFDLSSGSAGAARSLSLSADVLGKPEALAAANSSESVPGGAHNATLLFWLNDLPIVFGNSRTAGQAYGDIVGDVGSRKASSQRTLESREAIHAQVDAMRESLSGVSLDEEFVNLTKFQRAYEASARLLSTADELLQELLNIGR